MKIAISSAGKNMDSLLDKRFGRCDYFQIYDTENEQVKVVENKGSMSGGGAGIAAAQQIVDESVDTVITGNLGPNAFEIIDKAQINAYKCDEVSIKSALEKYNNKELSELKIPGAAHSGMGR